MLMRQILDNLPPDTPAEDEFEQYTREMKKKRSGGV